MASPSAPTLPESAWVNLADVIPNDYNVNRMTAWMYAKALESIDEFGFVSPLVVRRKGDKYELVDGEHRWRAARDLGVVQVPIFIVDGFSEAKIKKISLILNELKGQADPIALGTQLAELSADLGPDLMTALPYSEEIVKSFAELPGLSGLPEPPAQRSPTAPEDQWVEKTFRMPVAVGEVLDAALAKAKDEIRAEGKDPELFQAIEVISAEYLAG